MSGRDIYCKDWPDVLASNAEALELALRSILDEDEAVEVAALVLTEGWRRAGGDG